MTAPHTVAGHTAGPWRWFGNARTREVYLATTHSGRRYVMGFKRWGMRGAQPTFQPAERGFYSDDDRERAACALRDDRRIGNYAYRREVVDIIAQALGMRRA